MKKRFIEENFPVREINEEATRDKNIRLGHISTFHVWWARRPLASSRATNFAALIPSPRDAKQLDAKKKLIIKLSKWENSKNFTLLEDVKKEILEAHGGKPPKVLDPFSGGGAIPLEALRIGCETHAIDYNPVAVLVEKCTLEYPITFGERLIDDYLKWSKILLNELKEELGQFYPEHQENITNETTKEQRMQVPVAYIWSRSIQCQNPACKIEIPLLRQLWLSKKKNKRVALFLSVKQNRVEFSLVGDGHGKWPENYDPSMGTVSRAIVTCPACGNRIGSKDLRKLFMNGKAGMMLLAVVHATRGIQGKKFRLADQRDLKAFHEAQKELKRKSTNLSAKWGISATPDELLPPKGTLGFSIQNYGMKVWADLYNARQLLFLITLTDKVRQLHQRLIQEGKSPEYATALTTYFGLKVDMVAAFSNTLTRWENSTEAVKQLFSRQAISMVWDFAEVNPFSGSTGSWESIDRYVINVLKHCCGLKKVNEKPARVTRASATKLPFENDYFDAVFTDPPYYDNVPYSYLSDFFYVWLKRSIGFLHPDLFLTNLTPKSDEIVAYKRERSRNGARIFFEQKIKQSFSEIHRVLKPNGIAVIVYAHKTTEGWETIINALLESGLTITASWPLTTEMRSRLRAMDSAALASSIYLVARKCKRMEVGIYSKVRRELRKYLEDKLKHLWNEGISGTDFFIAAIGAGIEIFGRYKKIVDNEGNEVKANTLLEDVRQITANFAVKQILREGSLGTVSPLTRFYVLWRWNFKEARVIFDEAKKLAQSVGIDLEMEWNKGFIRKEREFIRVLGPTERDVNELKGSTELIDALHHVVLSWEKGDKESMIQRLTELHGESNVLHEVVEAIIQSLPMESKERKLLEGCFATGKKRALKNEIDKLKNHERR